jgi:hypothetical protein
MSPQTEQWLREMPHPPVYRCVYCGVETEQRTAVFDWIRTISVFNRLDTGILDFCSPECVAAYYRRECGPSLADGAKTRPLGDVDPGVYVHPSWDRVVARASGRRR